MDIKEKLILNHANLLQGFTIEKLAICLNYKLPNNLNYDKGLIGKLIQTWFYLSYNNNNLIDLPQFNIEIKTLTLNNLNNPINNIFITNTKLLINNVNWNNSNFKKKIKKILWIPIIKFNKHINYKQFLISKPFIWKMNKYAEIVLKKDWQELINIIILNKINNHKSFLQGDYLSLQKKYNKINKLPIIKSNKIRYSYNYAFYFKKTFVKKFLKL